MELRSLLLLLVSSAAMAQPPEWRRDLPPIRGLKIHDPSSILRCGDRYYCFSTGTGVVSSSSPDLKTWTAGPSVFPTGYPPAETRAGVPNFRGHVWAPDVFQLGERYALYYCVSAFGKQTSAIGLATSPTLDPASPEYRWRHEGVVIASQPGAPYNTIDPAIVHDGEQLWMLFGSYWDGIFLIELDPLTGLRLDPKTEPVRLADHESIEAAAVIRRGKDYFLFVNHGQCCLGVKSTYHIKVGRSSQLAGPYLDKEGKDLLEGGGELVLGNRETRIGPGHIAPIAGHETEIFGYHYYDAGDYGRPKLGIGRWRWTDDGWPTAETTEEVVLSPQDPAAAGS